MREAEKREKLGGMKKIFHNALKNTTIALTKDLWTAEWRSLVIWRRKLVG